MTNLSPVLTDRQSLVLDTLSNFIAEHGYSPTAVEMGEILDIRHSGVQRHLKSLSRKGRISMIPNKSRTIKILNYA